MASEVEICNLALSHLGVGKEIADLDNENSEEAAACRRFYQPTIEKTLQEFPWPFATRFADLALVEEDPTEEWAFSYRYPSTCLKIRRIRSGARQDSAQSRAAYRIASDDTGKLILTDFEDATIEYTWVPEDTGLFDPLFVEAVSYYLAFQIAPRVAGGDPFKLGERAAALYQATMARAQASALREQQDEVPLEAEHIRGR
jgi:hypothetical protein